MSFKKYNITIPDGDFDDLQIELAMILDWEEVKKKSGTTLSFHYEQARRIIWPELDSHRWHDLCRDEIVNSKICCLVGPGSSGKTHEAAWISLIDYWAHPHDTCILVSSTDIRGLKKRVWGEIIMLWERGVERFDYLAGNLLDSAIAITTDSIEDVELSQRRTRDMRKGIFGVPCWPTGTYVDTPNGKRRIEDLKVGDCVVNAYGIGLVKETMSRIADRLVRVRLNDGRSLDCTENHPFLTNRGWVPAIALETCDLVYSADEAVRVLRPSSRSRLSKSRTGFNQDCRAEKAWVESVEILKQDGDSRYSACAGGYRVHNLEISGHPSYSVNGVIVHNCVQGGQFVGLQKYQGIKQKRMRLVADEASAMGESFLSAFANLNNNEDFKAIILGNPQDPFDPLGRAAEPKEGWIDKYLEPGKTMTWDTRFMNGRCVNLIGTDSPNFDDPTKTRFKYLISKEKIEETLSFFAKDSPEYYSQCVGSMKIGTMARRVLDRATCEKYHAFDAVLWKGTQRTRIAALDASYGGDRCVLGWIEFGEDSTGHQVLLFHTPENVPIKVTSDLLPEAQIARFVRIYCHDLGIPPENFFHDSTGRGTLGTELAREWSAACNPVEFGGKPTKRPVSLDLYINDEKTKERRLKMCDEHYIKFVTELWFAVRYSVLSDQVRGIPPSVVEEFSQRKWDRTKDQKIELEKKEDMKERVGRSPDLADWAAIAVEGARQRGFQIQKLGKSVSVVNDSDWNEEPTVFEKVISNHMLVHA